MQNTQDVDVVDMDAVIDDIIVDRADAKSVGQSIAFGTAQQLIAEPCYGSVKSFCHGIGGEHIINGDIEPDIDPI